jgi:release factor glutamine methyltransferase
VAVAFREPLTQVTATDTSKPALAIARRNIARHGVATRVHLCETDLLDGLGAFDVILANLPYVCACDWAGLAPEIRDHEPREALIAGPSGTEAIARLLERAPRHLAPGGVAAIEFGDGQTDDVVALGRASFPEATVSVKKDLAGLDRVLVVRSSGG